MSFAILTADSAFLFSRLQYGDDLTMVKTFALVRSGIVYLGLRMALFMVWLGSMHIPIFPCGFSLTRMFESQSVVCVTFYDALVRQESLSNSSFTLSGLATGIRRTWACTGLTLGSSSMCMGDPRGFPRPGLNTIEWHCNTSFFVSFPSGGAGCRLWGISSSPVFAVSSAYTFK